MSYFWITNGEIDRHCTGKIPEGWRKGRVQTKDVKHRSLTKEEKEHKKLWYQNLTIEEKQKFNASSKNKLTKEERSKLAIKAMHTGGSQKAREAWRNIPSERKSEITSKGRETFLQMVKDDPSLNFSRISKTNKLWQQKLKEELGIEFELEVDGFDLVYQNLALEINPTVSHNSTYSFEYFTGRTKENNPLPKDYHYKKYLKAKELDYFLISIFDWYEFNKIVDLIKSKLNLCSNVLGARETELRVVKEDKSFLEENHLQNYASSSIKLGLFHKDELVQLATFGKPRFNKNYDWELIRLCTKKDYIVRGGKSKLLSFFKRNYPGTLISYLNLDISQGEGKYSESIGIWVKGRKTISANSVLKIGASRLIGDPNFKKYPKGLSNDEIMIKEGFVKVYNCGTILEEF